MRILLIDDDRLTRRSVRRVLDPPHAVVEAGGGSQGVVLAMEAGHSFDLILCDVSMPGVDGLDVYRTLKTIGSPLCDRMVFLTGGVSQSRALEIAAEVGGSRLIEKVVGPDVLRSFVDGWSALGEG